MLYCAGERPRSSLMPKMEALASDPRSRYEKRYRIARGGMRR
jgi:hypothetical protein